MAWYDVNMRPLPWRVNKDPYRILISEFMLQQTTVTSVIPYFLRWMERWPTLKSLATATEQDVLHQWQGLGYYVRARNLLKAAQRIMAQYDGMIPHHSSQLAQLPGIGSYTASAIAAIAFEEPTIPVDGNVMRIISRYACIGLPVAVLKPYLLKSLTLIPQHPGDMAQALMDLGASICRPKIPDCTQCPLHKHCCAFKLRCTDKFPVSSPRKELPQRYAWAFVIKNKDGSILLRQRPSSGILACMMEVPSTEWCSLSSTEEEALTQSPAALSHIKPWGMIIHTFTHFRLTVHILEGIAEKAPENYIWTQTPQDFALPTLIKKILRKAQITL